ncbi:hypothetical protein BFP71_11175 [Roseivirga misakiensis]|uniref:Uncharacterized protein n=1 Tax=Roseivirga misakiensis TaxID=1563681 RepID=A0A1E5SY47_9BACT|nr:hypothetical protein BFP71_11175 [Roseivirga misakiensis]
MNSKKSIQAPLIAVVDLLKCKYLGQDYKKQRTINTVNMYYLALKMGYLTDTNTVQIWSQKSTRKARKM